MTIAITWPPTQPRFYFRLAAHKSKQTARVLSVLHSFERLSLPSLSGSRDFVDALTVDVVDDAAVVVAHVLR